MDALFQALFTTPPTCFIQEDTLPEDEEELELLMQPVDHFRAWCLNHVNSGVLTCEESAFYFYHGFVDHDATLALEKASTAPKDLPAALIFTRKSKVLSP